MKARVLLITSLLLASSFTVYAGVLEINTPLEKYSVENFGFSLAAYQKLENAKTYNGDIQQGVIENLQDSLCEDIYVNMTGSMDYHDDDFEEVIDGACEKGVFKVIKEKKSDTQLQGVLTAIELEIENDFPIGDEMKGVGNYGFVCTMELQRKIDTNVSINENGDVNVKLSALTPVEFVTFDSNPAANYHKIEVTNAWKTANIDCKYKTKK